MAFQDLSQRSGRSAVARSRPALLAFPNYDLVAPVIDSAVFV